MSKFYLFCFLMLAAISSKAQTTVTVYSTGTAGDFTTGHTDGTTNTSGPIWASGSPTAYHGWAVFTLPTIPAGAVVTSCVIGFNTATYGGSGTPSGWATYGYVGNLATSASGSASTQFSNCTAGTLLSSATYGTTTGNHTLASTAASDTFIAQNSGSVVSICFTGGASRLYKITGLGGTAATTGTHAVYLQITYCTAPTAVSASTSSTNICAGTTLTLSGSATGATSYTWSGPGSYSGTGATTSFAATTANAGIYTLTATNVCGTTSVTATATTSAVAVNTPPTAISGTTTVCSGAMTTLSDGTTGGSWSISSGSITPGGVVTAGPGGSATVTYMIPTCTPVTTTLTVTTTPTAVTATSSPSMLCAGNPITLNGSAAGATSYSWSGPGGYSSGSLLSTFTATAANSGVFTLTATNSCGNTTATTADTVNPLPSPISGPSTICAGLSATLSDIVPSGTWTSSNPSAIVISSAGVANAAGTGVSTITYNAAGCSITKTITVIPPPAPIVGISNICPGGVMVIYDSSGTGTWSSSNPAIATISPVTGVIAAFTTGSTIISYTTACGSITQPLVVSAPPLAITGPAGVCSGSSISLTDATPGGSWHSADFTIATVNPASGVVTGVNGGSVLITYTTGPACITSIPVTVFPSLPTSVSISANPGTNACEGIPVGFVATPVNGGVSPYYAWSVGSTILSNSNTLTYTPVNGDHLVCKMVSTISCPTVDTAVASVDMTVSPNVTPSVTITITTVLPHDSVTFTGQFVTFDATITYGGAAPTIQWYSNGSLIPGATSNSYTTSVIGDMNVYCKVTSDAVCAAPAVVSSNQVKVFASYLGINDLTSNDKSITIYPNPNKGIFKIHGSAPLINGNVELTDISGRSVYHATINEPSGNFDTEIAYPELPQGLYLLKITGTDFSQTTKLVVEK